MSEPRPSLPTSYFIAASAQVNESELRGLAKWGQLTGSRGERLYGVAELSLWGLVQGCTGVGGWLHVQGWGDSFTFDFAFFFKAISENQGQSSPIKC